MRFLRFHNCFFIIALVVFVVEVFIALFVHDNFIRPYLGDVIVVWFVYYFIRAFVNIPALYAAVFTLLFRSEEHTSELQSRPHLVCRLLLEKKNIMLFFSLCYFNISSST